MQQLSSRLYSRQALGLMHIDREKRLYFLCKRCMDIVLSLLLLVATLPLLLLIALLIKVDSPGPVLFRQERVGLRKRSIGGEEAWQLGTFIMYKFRTMYHNSHPGIHQRFVRALIRGNETEVARLRNNSVVNKLTNDPRVTRVGKVLRKTRLDELPQIWNVLRGDMSLVGPRPPIAYEVAEYDPRYWRRLGTIPGCVGLWQVSGWCTVGFEDMVELDTWYIEHQSLWLDMRILLQTPWAVLSGKGGE
ncbi:MAG TPA: sugar transferase [Anaerolineae bacterium]|nr:sugar transferase [Anaerolineae bacterium]